MKISSLGFKAGFQVNYSYLNKVFPAAIHVFKLPANLAQTAVDRSVDKVLDYTALQLLILKACLDVCTLNHGGALPAIILTRRDSLDSSFCLKSVIDLVHP